MGSSQDFDNVILIRCFCVSIPCLQVSGELAHDLAKKELKENVEGTSVFCMYTNACRRVWTSPVHVCAIACVGTLLIALCNNIADAVAQHRAGQLQYE